MIRQLIKGNSLKSNQINNMLIIFILLPNKVFVSMLCNYSTLQLNSLYLIIGKDIMTFLNRIG